MNKMLSEALMVDLEMTDATTAATTSLKYDMQMYDRAQVVLGIRSTGMTTVTVDLMEATAATAAGSSNACSRAGVTIGAQGGTGITTSGGVREMTLTLGTACTASTFVIAVGGVSRPFAYTTSTASLNSSAWTTSQLYFGSTVGSTVATGLQLSLDSLQSALNSTLAFSGMLAFATDTTATLKLTCLDAAAGPITFSGGAADIGTITVQQAVVAFDAEAAALSTGGNRYIGIKTSTVGIACERNMTVIRAPGRYMPSGDFKGYVST